METQVLGDAGEVRLVAIGVTWYSRVWRNRRYTSYSLAKHDLMGNYATDGRMSKFLICEPGLCFPLRA